MSFTTDKPGVRKRVPGSSGMAFYIQRNLPFVSVREYRERRRDPEAQLAVRLSRELVKLADDFPRFRLSINKFNFRVLLQARSPTSKAKLLLKCLRRHQAASVRELVQESGLDFVSVKATLADLRSSGQAIPCNRVGRPLTNPNTKPCWRAAALNESLE
jgi:hypothetical protein